MVLDRGIRTGCGAGKAAISSRSHSRCHGHASRRANPSACHRSHGLRRSKDLLRSKVQELRSRELEQHNRSLRERLLHNHNRQLQELLRMGKEQEQVLRSMVLERELRSKEQELRSMGLVGSSSHRRHGYANGQKDQRLPNRQPLQQTW